MFAFFMVFIVVTAFVCASVFMASRDRAQGVPAKSIARGARVASIFVVLLWLSYFLAIRTLFSITGVDDPGLAVESPLIVAGTFVGVIAFALATLLAMWYASMGGWALMFYAGTVIARGHASAVGFAIQESQAFEKPTGYDRLLLILFILMSLFAAGAAIYTVVGAYYLDSEIQAIISKGE